MRGWLDGNEQSRRSMVAVGCIVASSLLGACTAPAHQVDLFDTSWTVVSIDDTPAIGSPRPRITFEDDGRTFTLETGCATFVGEQGYDTDGDALSFGLEDATERRSCTEEMASQEEVLLEAVLTTERWAVRSQDEITFSGQPPLQLTRDH
jgi:hypothetical protein